MPRSTTPSAPLREPARAPSGRLAPGAAAPRVSGASVTGPTVSVPDPDRLTHLQFRRFAGCPVCNLHLRSVARRHDEIAAAGIQEVALFVSSREALLPHVVDLPFAVLADPRRRLYRAFGVETSPRALLDPRGWPAIGRGVLASSWRAVRRGQPLPLSSDGASLGLPADFLIDDTGTVVASHYGAHVDDQWSVEQILAAARTHRAGVRRLSSPRRPG